MKILEKEQLMMKAKRQSIEADLMESIIPLVDFSPGDFDKIKKLVSVIGDIDLGILIGQIMSIHYLPDTQTNLIKTLCQTIEEMYTEYQKLNLI